MSNLRTPEQILEQLAEASFRAPRVQGIVDKYVSDIFRHGTGVLLLRDPMDTSTVIPREDFFRKGTGDE